MKNDVQLPMQLLDRLTKLYGEEELPNILQAMHTKLPSFRVNTLKTTPTVVKDMFIKQGFAIKAIPWNPNAYIVTNKSVREITETELFINGDIYIQNLSSMIPALILNPQPNEKVLDITAAPGSKTTQMAALMQNTGEITANDLSRKRLYRLNANLAHLGVTNTKVLNLPGESLWKKFPEYFDKTLVDVPCSMEGRINLDDPKSFEDWSPKKSKKLSKLQQYILRSAISATKIGGDIVYSTCTLSPDENEAVVAWVLEKTNGAVITEPISIPTLDNYTLSTWGKKSFTHINCLRINPTPQLEGFFIAKLHKVRSTLP